MKIVVADHIAQSAVDVLAAEKSWQVIDLGKSRTSLQSEITDADALLVRSATKVNGELLQRAPRLRVVGRAGVGVDNVDLDAATKKGVVVMNTPGGNAVSVAEQTLALLVSMARRIPQADASMKQGKWEKKKFTGIELRGKTLGLIGLGKIGNEVARLAQAYQMTVVAYDPYVSPAVASQQNIRLLLLEDVLKVSDFISLHCSLTAETHHLLNRERLALAKPGVRIANCARGELIDEDALLAALESGHVAGAGLDVFETEPPTNQRLVSHPNVIATPHIAGSTEEAQELVGIRIAEQVRDYLLTGVARHAVNLPALSPEEYKKLAPYLELGEKLGVFLAQIAGRPFEEVRISYDGGLAELNTHLVRNAVLKGLLSQLLDEEANLVNAGTLAKECGIEVFEVRSARRAAFSHSLGIAVNTPSGSASVLGMVGVRNALRILGINDIDIDAPLRGISLFIRNQDVPGVIGRIGTILGNRNINIASFAHGRSFESKEALGMINLDQRVPDDALAEIRSIPAVHTAQVVEI